MPTAPPLPTTVDGLDATVRPLVVTDSPALLEQLLRLADIAGVSTTVAVESAAVRRCWASAPLVIVGMDRAPACIAADLPRRSRVVLVGRGLDDGRVWTAGAQLGADHVVFLPDAERWLVKAFSDPGGSHRGAPATLGVVGGRRGSGSSTLAVALALAGLTYGLRTVLVDADPRGSGLGFGFTRFLPSLDISPLSRYASRRSPGPIGEAPVEPGRSPEQVPLPARGDLSVVAWSLPAGPEPTPAAMTALLSSTGRQADLMIIDLPWQQDQAAGIALEACRTTLVVLRGDASSTATAGRVCATTRTRCADVRAVVRRDRDDDPPPRETSSLLGVPLAGVVTFADIPHPRAHAGGRAGEQPAGPRLLAERLLAGLGILENGSRRPDASKER